jgi:HlyD family secretion protein
MKIKAPMLLILVISTLVLSACGGAPASPTVTPITATPAKDTALTIAEASVVPIQSANLTFRTGGIVYEILKPEGFFVSKGETIARLQRQEVLEASLAAAKLLQASANQALVDLKENGAVNRANAELALANADKELKDAKKRLSYKDYRRGSRDQINEAQARYFIAQDAFKTANDEYSELAAMEDDNLTKAYALTILSETRHNRDRALSDLNYIMTKPDIYDLHIAQGEVEVAQANYDKAKNDLSKLNANGINPEELAVAEANLNNANLQVTAAQAIIDDLDLKAPFDGTIISNNLKVGEEAGIPGQPSQVAIANTSEWEIETTDLSEVNVDAIHEGDPVKITYDALPDLKATGKVLRIESLGKDKQGDITYKVTIKLDNQDNRLRWNMTALVSFYDQSEPVELE